jgi:RimJ/RimL family protein N-acetyltransferase
VELLRTPRVVLRHWRMDDLPAYFDVYSRDEVMLWIGRQPRRALVDHDEARQLLDRWHRREADLPVPYGLWALVPRLAGEPGAGTPVGTVLLLPMVYADGPTDEVEIGWHLHPAWRGRGLVTEAAAALLARAADAGRRRVVALTDVDNVASQAVARRLGMTDQGITDRWFGLIKREFVWSPLQ